MNTESMEDIGNCANLPQLPAKKSQR